MSELLLGYDVKDILEKFHEVEVNELAIFIGMLFFSMAFGFFIIRYMTSNTQKGNGQLPELQIQKNKKRKENLQQFTLEEVGQHNKREDVWIIVRDKSGMAYVYDVTPYVDEHPGGDAILENAGGDTTEGFYGPQHPPRAFEVLDDFVIGTLIEE
eukprot:TRINITY_DN2418_c0_g1_i1.p2 TRINITY_DN2418_c0_g1~~TRINITY_DN2418_c0_g1_i1.p2  ORF type:complete len:155 (-),score=24.87 TRINITY_DN2418_c0_g1_i1:480-944(-)